MGTAMESKSGDGLDAGFTKQKRGGQLGNRNAFKHGFYSDQFKQAEKQNLGRIKNADLTNEIELLRVQMLRYLEAEMSVINEIDYETRTQALRTVSLAAETLTRLIRMQIMLNSDPAEMESDQEDNQTRDKLV